MEIIQFKKYWVLSKPSYNNTNDYILDIWKLFNKKNVLLFFPNLYTAIEIYLIIPIANCSTKRVFYKQARIKNKYRTIHSQKNLINFTVLNSKSNVLDVININRIIEDIPSKKARKNYV